MRKIKKLKKNYRNQESEEIVFFATVRKVGLQFAVCDYVFHATQSDLLEIYDLVSRSLERQSLFPL